MRLSGKDLIEAFALWIEGLLSLRVLSDTYPELLRTTVLLCYVCIATISRGMISSLLDLKRCG